MRLMQRRKRYEFLQRQEYIAIQTHRLRKLEPAVHDAVANTRQPITGKSLLQIRHEIVERPIVTERNTFSPGFLRNSFAGAILGDEMRRSLDAFDLTMALHLQVIRPYREEGKFETGGASIENYDCIHGAETVIRDS